MTISRRAITPADEAFLLEVYAGTRAGEMALLDWDDSQKAAFIRQQFDAQHRFYQQQYPEGSFQMILVDDRPAGRLYLHEAPHETRIIDIALVLEFRGQGIGTGLLREVLARAEARGASVTLHVERSNPARRWYEGLGFLLLEDQGVYLFLRWQPAKQERSPAPSGLPAPSQAQR